MLVNTCYINVATLNDELKKCDANVATSFIRLCEQTNPYHQYPFYNGVGEYVLGNYNETEYMPSLNELMDYKMLLHWKFVYFVSDDEAKEIGARYSRTWYQTFLSEWLIERVAYRGDVYVPYEVLHSLDNSIVSTVAHAFVDAFRTVYTLGDVPNSEKVIKGRLKYLMEVFKFYISDNKELLKKKDIAGETALEVFNRYYPTDVEQKPEWISMRELLEG